MTRKEEYERRRAAQESLREQKRRDSWRSRITDPNSIIQILLVGCTAGLIYVGFLQYRSLDRSNQILRQEQRALLAPDLIVPPANFVQKNVEDTELAVGFKNVGKVPAVETNEEIAPVVFKWADFRNKDAMDGYWKEATGGKSCSDLPLNPGGRMIFPGTHPVITFKISKSDVALIVPPFAPTGILVAGCLIYETFDEKHWTSVCEALEPIHPNDTTYRSTECFFHDDNN